MSILQRHEIARRNSSRAHVVRISQTVFTFQKCPGSVGSKRVYAVTKETQIHFRKDLLPLLKH